MGLRVRCHQSLGLRLGAAPLLPRPASCIAGITPSPAPSQGDSFLLLSVAVVVLGGTSLLGGRGYPARHGRGRGVPPAARRSSWSPSASRPAIQTARPGGRAGRRCLPLHRQLGRRLWSRRTRHAQATRRRRASIRFASTRRRRRPPPACRRYVPGRNVQMKIDKILPAAQRRPPSPARCLWSCAGSCRVERGQRSRQRHGHPRRRRPGLVRHQEDLASPCSTASAATAGGWSPPPPARTRRRSARASPKFKYADGQGNMQKAISDIKGMASSGVDAMVVFPDAGKAVLPGADAAPTRPASSRCPTGSTPAARPATTTTRGSATTSPTTASTGRTGSRERARRRQHPVHGRPGRQQPEHDRVQHADAGPRPVTTSSSVRRRSSPPTGTRRRPRRCSPPRSPRTRRSTSSSPTSARPWSARCTCSRQRPADPGAGHLRRQLAELLLAEPAGQATRSR